MSFCFTAAGIRHQGGAGSQSKQTFQCVSLPIPLTLTAPRRRITDVMKRRSFLRHATAFGAGLTILPTGTLFGRNTPNSRLNIALIGAYGRAKAHYGGLKTENVVAVCDVDENHIAFALEQFPNAQTYVDWRQCIEQKDLDAVVICTPDHTHAFIAMWAMNRGLHVYCEKPIANTVEHARLLRATYLQNRTKLATQAGTQRHAYPNFSRVRELIHNGAIGELSAAYAWGNRQLPKPGYLPAQGNPPSNLHYDLWLGPSPYHPYNPGYFGERPGANCLSWNMYWDFGTGQVGDMGNHTMDLVWNAIDARHPTSAQASGDPFNPDVTPVELTAHFEHPANDWRPPIRVSWYQGGAMPPSPRKFVDLSKIGHGAMFKGSKGFLVADFKTRLLIPFGDNADMSYYHAPAPEDVTPDADDFQREWINACKGDLQTSCNFDYNGLLTEQMALGLAAYRAGQKVTYDGQTGRITNAAAANAYLSRPIRRGWTVNG